MNTARLHPRCRYDTRASSTSVALNKQALATGLTPLHEAYALKGLGEIQLQRGDLIEGVDLLLRCLAARPITAGAAHDAAVRLEIIYQAAGRSADSAALAQVASATARPGVVLSDDYAEELRNLTRQSGAQ